MTLTSRNGNDLTGRFPDVARAATRRDPLVRRRPRRGDLRARRRAAGRGSRSSRRAAGRRSLVLFDLLELESEPLVDEPLAERRERLEQLVGPGVGCPRLPAVRRRRGAARRGRAQQELEGVVAKRLDSPYRPGRRSPDWQKLKLRQTQEVVIAGYTRGQGRRTDGFGALVVGVHDAGVLRWAGKRRHGLLGSTRSSGCAALLAPLERPDSPFAEVPKMPRVRRSDVTWVEPELVAEVEFAEWTHEGTAACAVVSPTT